MAFYTSWRLSVLAFCVIGPIMYVTQVYAQWSRWLYRQIYAALAIANGGLYYILPRNKTDFICDNYHKAMLARH